MELADNKDEPLPPEFWEWWIKHQEEEENWQSYLRWLVEQSNKVCHWHGSATYSMWAMFLGGHTKVALKATGEDEAGQQLYTVTGKAEGSIGDGAVLGSGHFNVTVNFSDVQAPCMWPVNEGDAASISFVGSGSIGVGPLSLGFYYVEGGAGKLHYHDGPFNVSGVNLVVPISGGGITAKFTELEQKRPYSL
jgi:hypothetical protein